MLSEVITTTEITLTKQTKKYSVFQYLGVIKRGGKKHKVLARELHFLVHKLEARLS